MKAIDHKSTAGLTATMSRERLREPKIWLGLQQELHLSDRELQVAIRLVLGDSLSQIAGRLQIGRGTVVTYCGRIKRKARVQRRGELAVVLLLNSGLLLGDDRETD